MAYEEAGGTATAITLNMPATLKDGYWKKFIAKDDNNGAATTVNGKPLYKVCSTNAPTLKANRPYEIYYNATNDCFFLKASATGTATNAQVLAGATYSTENDTDLVGTMPNRGAPTVALNCGGTYNIPAGYYSGGKVTANSLASQTSATATVSDILSGKTAWVNGSKITGTAKKRIQTTRSLTISDINYDLSASTKKIFFNVPTNLIKDDVIVKINIAVNALKLQYTYNGNVYTTTNDNAIDVTSVVDINSKTIFLYNESQTSSVTTGKVLSVTGTCTLYYNE